MHNSISDGVASCSHDFLELVDYSFLNLNYVEMIKQIGLDSSIY
ncbi:hypothetical protein IWX83_002138 [Flavobacterium sp. CG_9.1]|nr:hypothetical protein [Flavobacterium sp. CG_9.1]MBG6062339.1 hypothetical protein [Flavobacterium sp. CG_9.1]